MTKAKQDFYNRYSNIAIDQFIKYGIPASVTLSQMYWESTGGTNALSREANNYFGIKAGSSWKGSYVVKHDDTPNDRFRVYNSPEDSVADHSRVLLNRNYTKHLPNGKSINPNDWLTALSRGGYASAPNYRLHIATEINDYNLTKFDQIALDRAKQQGVEIGYALKSGNRPEISQSNQVSQQQKDPNLLYLTNLPGRMWSMPIDLTNLSIPPSGWFGNNRGNHNHGGVDFSTNHKYLPVYATEDNGKVVKVRANSPSAGNMIVVEYNRDGAKWRNTYMHLDKIEVKEGQIVNGGERIGVSGNTGRSTGPHLHFETSFEQNGKFVKTNPISYLKELQFRMGKDIPIMYQGKDMAKENPIHFAYKESINGENMQAYNAESLQTLTHSNDPSKWFSYINNNPSDGKDAFTSIISKLFKIGFTQLAAIKSLELAEQAMNATNEAPKEETEKEKKENIIRRHREGVDAVALKQTAAANYEQAVMEQEQQQKQDQQNSARLT